MNYYDDLYEEFYSSGKKYGLENNDKASTSHTKTIKSIEREMVRLQNEIRNLEKFIGKNQIQNNMGRVPPKIIRTKDQAIKELIKTAARSRENIANSVRSSITQVYTGTTTTIINEVKVIDNIQDFTSKTHTVYVRLIDHDYYSEMVDVKVVGMENVEWWEYVFLYGFFKQAKITFEYAKNSDLIKNGGKISKTVSGKRLEVVFSPKEIFSPKRVADVIDGQPVIREQGIKYSIGRIFIEIPLNKVEKINEYKEGYFIFEEKNSILEPDFKKLINDFEEIQSMKNINPELVEEIKKQITNYGRLSGV